MVHVELLPFKIEHSLYSYKTCKGKACHYEPPLRVQRQEEQVLASSAFLGASDQRVLVLKRASAIKVP